MGIPFNNLRNRDRTNAAGGARRNEGVPRAALEIKVERTGNFNDPVPCFRKLRKSIRSTREMGFVDEGIDRELYIDRG